MPKIVDREARQAEIITAAVSVFARRGFRGVGMAAVAAAAGMSKSALYHYFANKEALVGAIVAHLVREEEQAMQRAVESAAPDALLGAIIGALARSAAEWAAVGLLLFDLLALPSGRAALAEGLGRLRADLSLLLSAAQAAGTIREDLPAEMLAQIVLATVDGVLIQAMLGASFDADALRDALLALLVRG